MKNTLLFGGFILAVGLAGCQQAVADLGIASVAIATTAPTTVAVNSSIALGVTVNRSAGNTTASTDFTCSTSDATIATTAKTTAGCTVTGVKAGTVTITATSTADTTKKASKTITVTAATAPNTLVAAQNAGEDVAVNDTNFGNTNTAIKFAADTQVTSGGVTATSTPFACAAAAGTNPNSFLSTTNTISTTGTTNPAPAMVYASERFCPQGVLTYKYSPTGGLAAGNYTVRLHFRETFASVAGQRVFTAAVTAGSVTGTRTGAPTTNPNDIDIYSLAGGQNKAVVVEYTLSSVAASTPGITVTLTPKAGDPTISGIEIVKNS